MTSKFVKEIISELKNNPENFKDYRGQGVERIHGDPIRIIRYGNTRILSIIGIRFRYRELSEVPLLWIDKFLLEIAVKKWYMNATSEMLSK
jgi:hypothetical protein